LQVEPKVRRSALRVGLKHSDTVALPTIMPPIMM
jgi:hypothetical protein